MLLLKGQCIAKLQVYINKLCNIMMYVIKMVGTYETRNGTERNGTNLGARSSHYNKPNCLQQTLPVCNVLYQLLLMVSHNSSLRNT